MKEIRLWRISVDEGEHPTVAQLEGVHQTETEELLEEIIVSRPDLLLQGLKLVGRQTDTPGGPLDLLGVDGDGQMVVFELKRGTLTREAVAQVIDYGSYLSELDPEELSNHISERSGRPGIEKIDDFLSWYQEQFARSLSRSQKPKLVLVGLGADDRTRRMVSFLADSEVDVSLITFHAFAEGDKILLARQVEVEAKPPIGTTAVTKKGNLAKLKERVASLGVDEFYYEMARFCQKQLSAYQWPNPSGYSYYLPELTESGSESNRVFVSLYLSDARPREVQVRIHPRAMDAASDLLTSQGASSEHMQSRPDGGAEVWISSMHHWNETTPFFEKLCRAIVAGWKKRREQHASSETQLAISHIAISDTIKVREHVATLGRREGRAIGFRESAREGRATSAGRNDDGSLSYSISGSSPQGEEDTPMACRVLVSVLNASEGNWTDLVPSEGVVDCEAVDSDLPDRKLLIQVVRAIVDQSLWEQLNRQGSFEELNVSKGQLVNQMKDAIEKKANDRTIPRTVRQSLTLALDATRLPVLGFEDVVEEFQAQFGTWAKSLGFEAVWLVGPQDSLTWRLDNAGLNTE